MEIRVQWSVSTVNEGGMENTWSKVVLVKFKMNIPGHDV